MSHALMLPLVPRRLSAPLLRRRQQLRSRHWTGEHAKGSTIKSRSWRKGDEYPGQRAGGCQIWLRRTGCHRLLILSGLSSHNATAYSLSEFPSAVNGAAIANAQQPTMPASITITPKTPKDHSHASSTITVLKRAGSGLQATKLDGVDREPTRQIRSKSRQPHLTGQHSFCPYQSIASDTIRSFEGQQPRQFRAAGNAPASTPEVPSLGANPQRLAYISTTKHESLRHDRRELYSS